MKIAVSGSGGLVGAALVPHLIRQGHQVVSVVRGSTPSGHVAWDPETLQGVDAVVHLAGESIAGRRWSPEVKRLIRESRVQGTHLLSEILAAMPTPPQVVVSASATGLYGNRGDESLTEASTAGHDFLSEVCQAWENAWETAENRGIRVVKLRFGIILSDRGGALARMVVPFRLGLGGRLGTGKQYMSWVALEDVLRAIEHALTTPSLTGPVNVVAPEAVTNATFTQALGRVLGRPAWLSVPAWGLRWLLGDMADALLLGGARVQPQKLLAAGFVFRHPHLQEALGHILGKV